MSRRSFSWTWEATCGLQWRTSERLLTCPLNSSLYEHVVMEWLMRVHCLCGSNADILIDLFDTRKLVASVGAAMLSESGNMLQLKPGILCLDAGLILALNVVKLQDMFLCWLPNLPSGASFQLDFAVLGIFFLLDRRLRAVRRRGANRWVTRHATQKDLRFCCKISSSRWPWLMPEYVQHPLESFFCLLPAYWALKEGSDPHLHVLGGIMSQDLIGVGDIAPFWWIGGAWLLTRGYRSPFCC